MGFFSVFIKKNFIIFIKLTFNMDAQAIGDYFSTLSYHAPVMIITTTVFFFIRRKVIMDGKQQ